MISLRHKTRAQTLCTLAIALASFIGSRHTFGEEPVDFRADIRPILNQHCIACHGGVKQAGELSFVNIDDASYIVEPGEPDESILMERVTSEDAEIRMPPPDHGKALTQEEVQTLRSWIDQGGKWDEHWAFVAPQAHASALAQDPWVRQPLDGFVLERLEQSGMEHAKAAPHERWLRRASLDLTGLPPTPVERRKFLKACRENEDLESVYAAETDRLLSSPKFGERWASVWLDVVRYADSKGLGLDARRNIWKYRDWVIRALNNDLPFDEFTVKQIAGDLLPAPTMDDVLATACHRLTQTCEEGGTDDEMFRVEAVMDRVNTTMVAWQGLTIGCVQCHAHPYDPIDHEEYYQLLAFFNNSADCDLGEEYPVLQVPYDESQFSKAMELDEKIAEIRQARWTESIAALEQQTSWQMLQGFSAKTNNSTQVTTVEIDGQTEYQTRGTVAKNTTVTIESALPTDLKQLTAIRFTGLPENEAQALKDSEWGFVISHIEAEVLREGSEPIKLKFAEVIGDEANMLVDPNLSLDAKNSKGFGAYTRIHYPRSGYFTLEHTIALEPQDKLRIHLKQNVFALGAFPLIAHRGKLDVTGDTGFAEWRESEHSSEQAEQLAALKKERKAISSISIPVMRERSDTFARPTFVFDRGNFLTKSEPAKPNTPQFLPGLQTEGEDATRLDLANWLASSENPLTARVYVNRVWGQFFGQGLVLTQEDFGSSGQAPSHPKLLDDLAWRFMHDMRWSPKQLMREIVLSSTYRQSSVASPESIELDPQNRLLARGPRHRLPAETIRDQALAVSGLLSEKQFGAPVRPPIPDGVWLPFSGGDKWETPEKGNPDRYRRSIYTYTKRSIQFPIMASFDAPTREFCTPRRSPSNTPLQALMTLNDVAFVEASEALAQRMLDFSDKPKQRLRHGFVLTTARAPSSKELKALQELYELQLANHEATEEETQQSELSALASVAIVLLNLDEVFNK